ncbi:hypothetical protein [Pedobacter sp. P26]|uniref:hypothetical protein n=1 Tax=Pedobacter sp. P26 TaxID=3423956 RepID=UPI003D665F8C
MDLERAQQKSVEQEHMHATGLPQGKPPVYLTTGDKIPYNGSVYEVIGHLKQGRLKMQESLFGNSFTLSKGDKLYASLLYLKREMTNEQVRTASNGSGKNLDGDSPLYSANR